MREEERTMLKIKLSELSLLFDALSAKNKLYIPADTKGGARFLPYENGMMMTKELNTVRSPKDLFFPQTENLMDFKIEGKKIEVIDTRDECEDFVIFGVRACDVRSFEVLDRVFLSEPIDTYYKNRREHGVIVSLACNRPEETCFCSTFDVDCANPEGDVASYICGDEMYFEPLTEKGSELLLNLSCLSEGSEAPVYECKRNIYEIKSKLPLSTLSAEKFGKNMMEYFNSDKWDELSEACLGCGTCTFVCPTCQCYDIKDFDTGHGIKRFRCWDSCMYSDFTKMAHGNPRVSQKERFRQRFMHKLVYYPMNNDGLYSCVGCGRCISKCPISMNIVKVMKKLGEGKDE